MLPRAQVRLGAGPGEKKAELVLRGAKPPGMALCLYPFARLARRGRYEVSPVPTGEPAGSEILQRCGTRR